MLRILTCRLPEFTAQIEKFNRKAVKWGLPTLTINIISQDVEDRKEQLPPDDFNDLPTYRTYTVEVTDLEVIGDIPRIGGWAVHTKIEPSPVKGENFVFTQPNFEQDDSLRTRKLFCEHCNSARLRARGYLIQHEDGRQMLVGADCLKDFLPGVDVENLLAYMNGFKKACEWDEDDMPPPSWENRVYPVDYAITDALCAIRKFGFVSKAKAQEGNGVMATADFINPAPKLQKELYEDADLDELLQRTEEFKNYMMAKDSTGNDYIYNIQLALRADYIKPKLYGYVAAGINTWLKETEEKKTEKATRVNEWVGIPKTRYTFKNMRVMGLSVTDGMYGNTYIYRFLDEAGHSFVWFGSNEIAEVDEVINIKATVKEHGEYKGWKQTVLTRCVKF